MAALSTLCVHGTAKKQRSGRGYLRVGGIWVILRSAGKRHDCNKDVFPNRSGTKAGAKRMVA
tara:strand:+ start:161 stop:346 length:186 start_codon:yes stop_codon:yes gene_type:complete